MRLAPIAGQHCADLEYWDGKPQILSNGQSYALRASNSLMVGSLNGGTPTTIETMPVADGILILVGMTYL